MPRIAVPLLLLCMTSQSVRAEVSVVDSGRKFLLRNGFVTMTLDKDRGRLFELAHEGRSLLSPGQTAYLTIMGTFVDDSETAYAEGKESQVRSLFLRTENCRFQVHAQGAEMVDVSCTPERPDDFPFEIEIHYVLRAGESGFYCYVVARKPEELPDALLTQLRFGMRVDDSIRNIRLNDQRSGVLPSSEEIVNARGMVMDATYVLTSGEIVTKYSWASETEKVPVFGLNDGKQGVWLITGGNDFLCGGPTKQHNTCHATDKGPILLKLLYSNHYGSRGSFVSGDWEKLFGPVFVYLNQKDDAEALWTDAKQQGELHRMAWPYAWLDHPESSINGASVTGRFDVSGQVSLNEKRANPSQGWVVLARPREYRGLDWQQQGADTYIYRARIEEDGSFEIPAVRDGTYTLYAFAAGVVGEYRQDNVTVDSTGEVQLGRLPWSSRSFGKLLWRVGTPNRTADEYRRGDEFRQWGVWLNYPRDFPDDVDFTIGKSRERVDWNYAHMAVWEEAGGWTPRLIPDDRTGEGIWRLPTWKVRFHCDKPMRGVATLTLALASVSREGGLAVGLNSESVGQLTGMTGDSALPRNGIRGIFREHFVAFDASRLRVGENVLTLDLLPAKQSRGRRQNYPYFGIMYDFAQLEVDENGTP